MKLSSLSAVRARTVCGGAVDAIAWNARVPPSTRTFYGTLELAVPVVPTAAGSVVVEPAPVVLGTLAGAVLGASVPVPVPVPVLTLGSPVAVPGAVEPGVSATGCGPMPAPPELEPVLPLVL
jgi:hypothetical protein